MIFGRNLQNEGNIYINTSILHRFGRSNDISGSYQTVSGMQRISTDTAEDNNIWFEIGLGANLQMSKNSTAYINLGKSFGGDVREKWQVNTGLCWRF